MNQEMNEKKRQNKIFLISLSGLFTAMIFILTAYVHVPTGQGYTHAGDGLIYLAACILPTPYAVAASALGGALADGLSGFIIWLPGTLVIKAVTALFFTSKRDKIICLRNILGIIPSWVLCVCAYSLYQGTIMTLSDGDSITFAAIGAAFLQTPTYTIQVVASSVLFIILGLALDKMNFKKKFLKLAYK